MDAGGGFLLGGNLRVESKFCDEETQMSEKEEMWLTKCIEFHGHECGGLWIGFKAALYVRKLLDVEYSSDEELVCVTENDACGVDAIQVMLGCSVGKGNLLFKLRGKQAFRFYRRDGQRAVRLLLKETMSMSREEKLEYLKKTPPEELFSVEELHDAPPSEARIFTSVKCDGCKELTAENMLRLQNGKKLCLDCYRPYTRFIP